MRMSFRCSGLSCDWEKVENDVHSGWTVHDDVRSEVHVRRS